MEDPQTIRGRPRPTTPLPIQRFPLPDAFTPAHCAPVFPVGQPTPGLARPSCPCLSRRPRHPSTRRMHRDAGYLPRQRSGQVPLPVGSAPHNPDRGRQRVGISQPGADGPATTPGLDSSHGPSIACPSRTDMNPQILATTQYPIEAGCPTSPHPRKAPPTSPCLPQKRISLKTIKVHA